MFGFTNLSKFACGAVAAAFLATVGSASGVQAASLDEKLDAAVDLGQFVAPAETSNVTVMAQINRSYQFPITDGAEGQSYLIPLFGAAGTVDSTNVVAAVMVDDLVAFEEVLSASVVGNGRIGDLFVIEGIVSQAGIYEDSVNAALEMASLSADENFTIISAQTRQPLAVASFPILPFIFAFVALGVMSIFAAIWAFRRDRSKKDVVADRFGALQGYAIPAE